MNCKLFSSVVDESHTVFFGIFCKLCLVLIKELFILTLGVNDGDTVSVEIPGERSYTMHGVEIRITKQSALEFHIDTDEANAAGASQGTMVQLIK